MSNFIWKRTHMSNGGTMYTLWELDNCCNRMATPYYIESYKAGGIYATKNNRYCIYGADRACFGYELSLADAKRAVEWLFDSNPNAPKRLTKVHINKTPILSRLRARGWRLSAGWSFYKGRFTITNVGGEWYWG